MGGTAHLVCTAARSRSQFVNLQDYTDTVFYMPWKPFGSVRRFFGASHRDLATATLRLTSSLVPTPFS